MKVIETIAEMRSWSRNARARGEWVSFVPTMGFLHEGHGTLLAEGRRRAEHLVLSIFVNPTQFDQKADLESYPRDLERDMALARRYGVDVVFVPCVAELYPEGHQTSVSVGALAGPLCGAARPGHFQGVATVVAKLFLAVEPDLALFGEKDYQQLAVICQMTRDLGLPVEIVGMPIVREPDGLAMSSRNARLLPEERQRALALHRSVEAVRKAHAAGERDARRLENLAREVLQGAPGVQVDYAEVRNARSLERIDEVEERTGAVYAVAAFVGAVRLIDNALLVGRPLSPRP